MVSSMPLKSVLAAARSISGAANFGSFALFPGRSPEPDAITPANFQGRSTENLEWEVGYAVGQASYYTHLMSELGLDVRTANVLELGPGYNFGHALIMASHGMWLTLADRFLAPWDPGFHPALYAAVAEAWSGPDAALRRTLEKQTYSGSIGLVGQSAEALTSLADGSFDLVFSNAVLEHVYDMRAVARELARVTRPGGYSSHQIDFRDHHDFERPLEFLLIDDDEYVQARAQDHWERGNRLRVHETEAIFAEAGFEVISVLRNDEVDADYLADFLPRLRATGRYPEAPEDSLATAGARFLLRKR